MKKAVITGGAGFIGSHLAEGVSRQGYQVVILDDLSAGKMENIADLLKNAPAEFIRGSIVDLRLLQKVFRDAACVFHLAAIASVPKSMKDPLGSHEVNLTGTLNVLQAARENGVKKVVYASSAAVYGDTRVQPTGEGVPTAPQSPYAVSKLAGEYYCRVFQEAYGMPAVCLRYFNIYGPRQDPASEYAAVIPAFIQKASRGEPLTIYGDGKQTRDFVYVKDVVQANLLAAESGISGVFNIGSGEAITINRLAVIINKLTGNKSPLVYRDPRPGDILHSLADIKQALKAGYRPGYALEAGLREMIQHSPGPPSSRKILR
jgi:UDP-glucose 4-epimerase